MVGFEPLNSWLFISTYRKYLKFKLVLTLCGSLGFPSLPWFSPVLFSSFHWIFSWFLWCNRHHRRLIRILGLPMLLNVFYLTFFQTLVGCRLWDVSERLSYLIHIGSLISSGSSSIGSLRWLKCQCRFPRRSSLRCRSIKDNRFRLQGPNRIFNVSFNTSSKQYPLLYFNHVSDAFLIACNTRSAFRKASLAVPSS